MFESVGQTNTVVSKSTVSLPDIKESMSTGSFKIQPNTPSGENWTKWILPMFLT